MRVGSLLQFEVPDKCPDDCKLKGDIAAFGQNSLCTRCPVFNCETPDDVIANEYSPILDPIEYRDDWAAQWVKFFLTGEEPELYF